MSIQNDLNQAILHGLGPASLEEGATLNFPRASNTGTARFENSAKELGLALKELVQAIAEKEGQLDITNEKFERSSVSALKAAAEMLLNRESVDLFDFPVGVLITPLNHFAITIGKIAHSTEFGFLEHSLRLVKHRIEEYEREKEKIAGARYSIRVALNGTPQDVELQLKAIRSLVVTKLNAKLLELAEQYDWSIERDENGSLKRVVPPIGSMQQPITVHEDLNTIEGLRAFLRRVFLQTRD